MDGSTIMTKVLKKPLFFNLIYQGLLLFTIGQQIYYPQSYSYMHLVIVIVRLVVSEMYQNEHRVFDVDKILIPSILLSSIISIVEKAANISLGILYLSLLLIMIACLITIIRNAIEDSKENLKEKMNKKHIEAYEKSPMFILGIFYGIYLVSVLGFVYAIYEIIGLIF